MISKKSIPWPNITTKTGKVPLMKRYALRDMSYLDTLQAQPIFEKQANIIVENNYKGLVDIGCRHGPINDFLKMKNYEDYQYYGFDTSPEPIEYAQQRWINKNNIEYEVRDWVELKQVNYKVDCVIFSGVLLYEKDHYKMFTDIMKFYNCQNAIIQEPYHTQKHYDERLHLKTITNDMKQYKFKEQYIVEAEIFCGRRLIAHI